MLLSLGLVLPYLASTNEREGQLLSVLLLPAAYIRQHRVARSAAGVRKERHHRLARRAQGLEGETLAVKAREAELRGGRAYRKTFCLVASGAILRGRYATAFCKRCLHGLQAHQQPPVLPQEVEKKPPLPGQEEEHEDPDQETQKLGRRERSNPGESAGSGTAAFVARPKDEACHGCKYTVAG